MAPKLEMLNTKYVDPLNELLEVDMKALYQQITDSPNYVAGTRMNLTVDLDLGRDQVPLEESLHRIGEMSSGRGTQEFRRVRNDIGER